MYYLNSRYYNPDWGRFINADGIVGQTGELLSGNMFAYCKNNPVNMQDNDGYRPDFGDGTGRETNEDREVSFAAMSSVNMQRYQQKHKYDYVKDVARSTAISTGFSIGDSVISHATLGHTIVPYKFYNKMPIPVKLSTFDNVGRFFKVISLLSFCNSVQDNFSGKYSKGEAWFRTVVDGVALGIGLALGPGLVAVGIGLGVGLAAEAIKGGVDLWIKRNPT